MNDPNHEPDEPIVFGDTDEPDRPDARPAAGVAGGFEFGAVSTPPVPPSPVPAPMSDIERLIAMTVSPRHTETESVYRGDGGPLVAGKEGRYEDLEALGGESIEVKFAPNELIRYQGSQVYMLDAKGAPHFLHPWDPASAAKLTSSRITRYQLATAVCVLLAGALSISGAFTDREYVDLVRNGDKVTATVSQEVFEGLQGEDAGMFDHVLTFTYGDDQTIEMHTITETPDSGENVTTVGSTMVFYVDPEDPARFAKEREDPEPAWSVFSLTPLAGVVFFANKWAATGTVDRKMRKLAKGPNPLEETPKKVK